MSSWFRAEKGVRFGVARGRTRQGAVWSLGLVWSDLLANLRLSKMDDGEDDPGDEGEGSSHGGKGLVEFLRGREDEGEKKDEGGRQTINSWKTVNDRRDASIKTDEFVWFDTNSWTEDDVLD